MTPKEKAKELVDKFSTVGLQQRNEGIPCAIIAVDEILSLSKIASLRRNETEMELEFWQEVKQEIENL